MRLPHGMAHKTRMDAKVKVFVVFQLIARTRKVTSLPLIPAHLIIICHQPVTRHKISLASWHGAFCKAVSFTQLHQLCQNSTAGFYRFKKSDYHTHNRFTTLFPGQPRGWAGARRKCLRNFMVQGKITEADTLTIRLGTIPSRLISVPPPSSPIFMPDALLPQPSQFILAWDRHQICCPVAYQLWRNSTLYPSIYLWPHKYFGLTFCLIFVKSFQYSLQKS